jgi:hypothetical protein
MLVVGSLFLAACSTPPKDPAAWITPIQAIYLASKFAPEGVEGTFVFDVKSTGRGHTNIYLCSELDYRDQVNLSIAITPSAAADLKAKYGSDPEVFFLGKRIAVTGMVKRVQIDFFDDNGQNTGKYYYQTHVDVTSADQIIRTQ